MNPFIKGTRRILTALVIITSLIPGISSLAAPGYGVTVKSVRRMDPNPTNAEIVRYTVTFSSPVIDVDMGDFGITTTGEISGVFIVRVTGSGNTRSVLVNTGSGNGTIRLDVIDNDTIESTSGAYFTRSFFGGEVYTVEKGPSILSIIREDANSSSADSVDFIVTFSTAVTGVDTDDFTLVITGEISGAFVSAVSGSGDTYIITVNTGNGNGTIRLDVIDNDTIEDLAGKYFENPYSSDEENTIDKVPPTVVSVTPVDANPISAASVDFIVIFSKPVIDVAPGDFSPTITGRISGPSVSAISGSGDRYIVTVNTGSGSGTIRLDVIDNDTIEDLAGNYFESPYFRGEAYTVDKAPPTVTIEQRPSQSSPATANPIIFDLVFSEPMTGFDNTDLKVSGMAGTPTVLVTGSGATYTVEVAGMASGETVTLEILANAVQDAAGNYNEARASSDSSLGDELAPPTVSSVIRLDANPTNAASVDFIVTFSEAVINVDKTDFSPTTTGGIIGASTLGISGSGNRYVVTVNTGSGSGTVRLDVIYNGSIEDLTGDSFTSPYFRGEAYKMLD